MVRLTSAVKETLSNTVRVVSSKEGMKKLLGISLYRNAFYLVLNTMVGSLLGFVFWIIVARLYTPADVGLAAQSDKSNGEFFVIGSSEPIKFIDMARMVIKTVGKGELVHVPFPKDRKAIEVKKFYVTYEKLNRVLGWHPVTSLEEGLSKTFAFYQERLNEYL